MKRTFEKEGCGTLSYKKHTLARSADREIIPAPQQQHTHTLPGRLTLLYFTFSRHRLCCHDLFCLQFGPVCEGFSRPPGGAKYPAFRWFFVHPRGAFLSPRGERNITPTIKYF